MNLSVNELSKLNQEKPNVITVGIFDSIHNYHYKVIKKAAKIAEKENKQLIVLSINKKVSSFLNNIDDQILDLELKNKMIAKISNDIVIINLHLDQELVEMPKEQFIGILKNNLKVEKIVEGEDFRFGYKALGDINYLKNEFGLNNVFVIKRKKGVSSSEIKILLKDGNIKRINKVLFEKIKINVESINGDLIIKYPQVNIKSGVYKVRVDDDNKKMFIRILYNKVVFFSDDVNIKEIKYITLLKFLEK